MPSSSEQRIVELVLKSIGDDEVRKMAAELLKLRGAAEQSAESLKYLEEAGAKVGEQFKEMGAKIVAGFALEGIVEKLKGAAEEMEGLALASQKVGISVKNLQDLDIAANLTGTNVEQLHKGLELLTKNMVDLAGKGGPATKYLRDLGITAGTDVNEAFTKLSEQFAKMPDGAQKTALAMLEFGKAGAQLIPMLNKSGELLKEIDEVSDNWGTHLTDQEVTAVAELTDHVKVLNAEVGKLTDKLLAGLAPALDAVAKQLMNAKGSGSAFLQIGEWIGARLVELVGGFEIFKGAIIDALDAIKGFGIAAGFAGKAFWDFTHGQPQQVAADLKAVTAEIHATSMQMNADVAQGHANALKLRADYLAGVAQLSAAPEAKPEPEGTDLPDLTKHPKAKKVKVPVDHSYRDAMKELTEQLKLYENAAEDALKVTLTQREAWDKTAVTLEKAADPLRQYMEDSAKLLEVQKNTHLSQAAFDLEMKAITQRFDDQSQKLYENSDAYKANQLAIQQHAEMLQKLKDTWGFVADAAAQATQSIIENTESIGTAVRRMVATIISQLAKLALEKLATKLLAGLFPSNIGTIDTGAISQAAATVSIPNLPAYASGGIVGTTPGGIGIVGEAGPEMVAPLKRDASGNLGVGATQPQVTVNNYHGGADVAVSQSPQGVQIDIVRRQLADDIARGGNPVSRALERTYGVGRYAGAYG
jgi:hypothetical protein